MYIGGLLIVGWFPYLTVLCSVAAIKAINKGKWLCLLIRTLRGARNQSEGFRGRADTEAEGAKICHSNSWRG